MSVTKSFWVGVGLLAPALTLLTGCGAAPEIGSPVMVQGAAIHGTVHGGQQPVGGAHIHVLAASSNGSVSGAPPPSVDLFTDTSLPKETLYGVQMAYVASASDGSFSIGGDYSCTEGQVVYLLVSGGNPGLGGTVNNAALALMAVLGTCPGTGSFAATVPDVNITEVTTVAAGYALNGYFGDPGHLSYDGTALALAGIQNAAANAGNLVNLGTGTAYPMTPGSVANGISGKVPVNTIYALADALASCVNSNGALTMTQGTSTVNTNCGNLFSYATTNGTSTGTQPSDTAMALLNIARNPDANLSNLYDLAVTTPPYPTSLSGAPTDWSLGVEYDCSCFSFVTGGDNLASLAIGANGHVWVGNTGGSSVFELTSLGTLVSGEPTAGYGTSASFSYPLNLSIDSLGNVWFVESFPSDVKVFKISGSGATASVTSYNPISGLIADASGAVAVDGSNHVWIGAPDTTNLNNNSLFTGVIEMTSSGALVSGEPSTGYDSGTLPVTMYGLALDNSGNVWVGGRTGLVEMTGLPSSPVYTKRASSVAYGFALDGNGNAWVGTQGAAEEITGTSGNSTTNSYPGAGSQSNQVAIDGAGVAWFTGNNSIGTSPYVAGIAGTPTAPVYTTLTSIQQNASAIAVDGSGDLWTMGNSASAGASTVVQIIGAATPVVTPITPGSATTTGKLGIRP